MKLACIIVYFSFVACIGLSLAGGCGADADQAQDQGSDQTKIASQPASQPVDDGHAKGDGDGHAEGDGHDHSQPEAPAGKAAATVGKTPIPAERLEQAILQQQQQMLMMGPALTAEDIDPLRKRILGGMIERVLIEAHLKTLACTDKELADFKATIAKQIEGRGKTVEQALAEQGITDDMLRMQIKMERLQAEATTKEKIAAVVKAGPVARFDGTTVEASHILITCAAYMPKAVKDKAKAQLAKIAKDIKAGRVKFADAAKQHSACPSGARGGDLGEFTFDRMAEPFSEAAFGLKVGEMSGIVETSFGYHLIKTTTRSDGPGKPGPRADEQAANALRGRLHAKIIKEAAAKNPVKIN